MSRKIYPPYPRKGSGGCNYVDSGVLDTCEYVTHPGTSQKVVAFYQTNGGEKIFEKNQMLGLVIAILRFYPGWQVRCRERRFRFSQADFRTVSAQEVRFRSKTNVEMLSCLKNDCELTINH